jgi:hypothetical protein
VGVIVLSNETNVGLPDAIGAWTFEKEQVSLQA